MPPCPRRQKGVCIHSQLKSCAFSEVAAVGEGLMLPSTDAEIELNHVDAQGARVTGCAFTELGGFRGQRNSQ